jgi:UDP-N-acetylglucosamine 2-epimerase (non-hydrolysing)
MIVVFYGTSAELIKMVGIIQRIPRSELLLICSSQHNNGLKRVHEQLGIQPDISLSNGWFGKDVMNIKQMLGMMIYAHLKFLHLAIPLRRQIQQHDKKQNTKSIAVVHGDTLTTVIGCYMGRALGLQVAHVEAGLRTHNWRSPFPEELDRRIAGKFARIHFPPSELAEADLKNEKARGLIVNTQYNTAKDAIEQSTKLLSNDFKNLKLPVKYCLVLLHRTELIENKSDLEAILKVVHSHASLKTPVVFTEHSTTWEKIRSYGFEHYLEKEGLTVIHKQPYFDFMEIVRQSEYILTDGGGLQEDAFFLGIPTIIHRKVTERQDGIGFNAELSGLDTKKVTEFLKNHKNKRDLRRTIETVSPSQIVIDTFTQYHFFTNTPV